MNDVTNNIQDHLDGADPHRAAKDASLCSRAGVVAGGDEQRRGAVEADPAAVQHLWRGC
jgi:hypothetical protein